MARAMGTVLALVVVLGAACGASGGEPGAEERAAIAAEAEAAVASLFAATNARDAEAALAHYLPTDELVNVACTTIRQGFAERQRILRMWHEDRPESTIDYDIVRTQTLGRDAAVVAARGRSSEGTSLFWTFVLRRDAGEWRVVQEHQSWPGCREVRVHPAF